MPTVLDNSIPIENVHCLIHFLLCSVIFYHIAHCYRTPPQGKINIMIMFTHRITEYCCDE